MMVCFVKVYGGCLVDLYDGLVCRHAWWFVQQAYKEGMYGTYLLRMLVVFLVCK